MAEGNRIPTRSREIVAARSGGACERCSGPATDWHHRRRRRIKGPHQHCPCNGVHLCAGCHAWAHRFPPEARATGHIVVSNIDPHEVPVLILGVWWLHDCTGGFTEVETANVVLSEGIPRLRT